MAMEKIESMLNQPEPPRIYVGPSTARGVNETLAAVAATLSPLRAQMGSISAGRVDSGTLNSAGHGGYVRAPQLYLSALNENMLA
jgi:hypothetical protein